MVSDARAMRARDLHRSAGTSRAHLERYRVERNQIIRELRAEDRELWTYQALAAAVGCSKELIAAIVQGRTT
jgi:hypothetical protein